MAAGCPPRSRSVSHTRHQWRTGFGKIDFLTPHSLLVDPNAAPIRAAPRDERDLIVAAGNSHVIAMDNLSKVDPWLADGMCRLATGGGFSTRCVLSDKEEAIFQATRPIILNGIPLLTERADLADRAVTVRLVAMPEDERRPEDEFWQDWNEIAPRVLGSLCDGLSSGIRYVGQIRLERAPRMADFAKWQRRLRRAWVGSMGPSWLRTVTTAATSRTPPSRLFQLRLPFGISLLSITDPVGAARPQSGSLLGEGVQT